MTRLMNYRAARWLPLIAMTGLAGGIALKSGSIRTTGIGAPSGYSVTLTVSTTRSSSRSVSFSCATHDGVRSCDLTTRTARSTEQVVKASAPDATSGSASPSSGTRRDLTGPNR